MTLIWVEIVKEIYSKNKLITINKLSRKFLFCSSNDREKMDFYEHLKEIRDGIGNKNWAIFRKTSSCCIYIYIYIPRIRVISTEDTQGNRATRGART